jgi:type VI secretion system secreted protein Hcp
MSKTKLAAIVVGLTVAGGLGAALAYATSSDAGSVTACVAKDGSPRIVSAGTACKDKESTVAWAIQGPQGPAGPQGPKGDQGAAAAGGHTLTVIGNMTATRRDGKPIMGGDGTHTTIDVVSMSQGIVSPRDAASGLPTGKRMHKPFIITKEWDASSPVLFQACSTNETIPKAEFHFFAPGSTAESVRITLLDASCAEISQTTDDSTHEVETIAFTFRRIEYEHLQSKTMYADDWTATTN